MDYDNSKNKIKIVFRILCLIFIILFVSSLCYEHQNTSANCYSNFTSKIKQNTLNDYLTYNINDSNSKNISMNDVTFIPLNKGDVMTIKINLNKNYSSNDVLLFMQEYCIIDAYVGGENVYSYGHSLDQMNQCLGGGYFKIPIENNYIGKELKIILTATKSGNISGLESVSVESKDNVTNSFIVKNIVYVVAITFLLLLGSIIFVITFFKTSHLKQGRQICSISLCYIFMGLWIAGHFKIPQIISNDLQLINSLEYVSLYIGVVPFVLFFQEIMIKKIDKIFYYSYFAVTNIFLISTILLKNIAIIDYVDVLPMFRIWMLLGCILICIFFIKRKNDLKNVKNISFVFGMILVNISIVLEIARFYLYTRFKISMLSSSFAGIIAAIFVLLMIYIYIVDVTQKMNNDEEAGLIDLAFKDQLTQVPNRTKCEEYMRTLSGKINESYTVINLDLNNLKRVNDSLGHHIGDEMIYAGAQIIKSVFGMYGQVGRMGGDEFIAIITIIDKDEIDKLIQEMNNKIQEFNKENKNRNKFTLSIAYGYAIKNKASTDSIWKIYEEADKIMYECKKKQKSAKHQ